MDWSEVGLYSFGPCATAVDPEVSWPDQLRFGLLQALHGRYIRPLYSYPHISYASAGAEFIDGRLHPIGEADFEVVCLQGEHGWCPPTQTMVCLATPFKRATMFSFMYFSSKS